MRADGFFTTRDAKCPACGDVLWVDYQTAEVGSRCTDGVVVKWPYLCSSCGSHGEVLSYAVFKAMGTWEEGSSKVVYMDKGVKE